MTAKNIDEKKFRTFLLEAPRASRIVVRTADDTHEIAPAGGDHGSSRGHTWAAVARSIIALGPECVEIYDTQDKLVRAMRFDDEAETEKQRNLSLGIPLNADPETARFVLFSKLHAEAYRFATETAFSKMVELFERVTERSMAIEARLERTEAAYRRTMNDQLQDAYDEALALKAEAAAQGREVHANDPLSRLAALGESFLGGMQGAQKPRLPNPQPSSPTPSNGSPNGAHKS